MESGWLIHPRMQVRGGFWRNLVDEHHAFAHVLRTMVAQDVLRVFRKLWAALRSS